MTNSSTKKPTKTNPKSAKKPPNENNVLEIDRLLTTSKSDGNLLDSVKVVKIVAMSSTSLEDVRCSEGSHQKKKRKREEEDQDQPEKFTKIGKCVNSGAIESLKKTKMGNSAVANKVGGGVRNNKLKNFGIQPSSSSFDLRKNFRLFERAEILPGLIKCAERKCTTPMADCLRMQDCAEPIVQGVMKKTPRKPGTVSDLIGRFGGAGKR